MELKDRKLAVSKNIEQHARSIGKPEGGFHSIWILMYKQLALRARLVEKSFHQSFPW